MKSLKELLIEGIVEWNIDAICNKLQLDFTKVKFTKEELIKGIQIEIKKFGTVHRNLFRAAIKAVKNLYKDSNYYENVKNEGWNDVIKGLDGDNIDDVVPDNSYTELY